MFYPITQILLTMLLLLPPLFYKNQAKRWHMFYLKMTFDATVRHLYLSAVTMLILFFGFVSLHVIDEKLWVLPSMALGFIFICQPILEMILKYIRKSRGNELITFALFFISMIEPKLISLSFAIAISFVSAAFFPSKEILYLAKKRSDRFMAMSPDEFVECYYQMNHAIDWRFLLKIVSILSSNITKMIARNMKRKQNKVLAPESPDYTLIFNKKLANLLHQKQESRFSKYEAFRSLLELSVSNEAAQYGPTVHSPLVVTITQLSVEWKWHRHTVSAFLDDLVKIGILTKEKTSDGFSIVMSSLSLSEDE